jgi:hypothetical protein
VSQEITFVTREAENNFYVAGINFVSQEVTLEGSPFKPK